MKFLHVMSSADARGGGPIEGVRQRGLHLQEMGHAVDLVTLDDPRAPWLTDFPLTVHALGPSHGRYGYNPRLVPWLEREAGRYDLVVVNGLWQYHSFAAWRALRRRGVPYVVFTHGMLDPWFKRTYPLKHFKKWLYWPWADYRVLRDAAAVLFTSEQERLSARQSFWLYRANERVVAYGTRKPPSDRATLAGGFLAAHPELQGKRLLLFLGRIHEKKGCDLLIDAFARVACAASDLHLVMAGPDQHGWRAALAARAQGLGIAPRVTWTGMLQGESKWGALHAADAFVLPSHQENFGIAVVEALGCGLPVLISDKVNIWHEVVEAKAGFAAPDSFEGTRTLLERWLRLSDDERRAMADAARRLFDERFTVESMARDLLLLCSSPKGTVA